VPAGTTVRVRVVNTDNGPMRPWVAGAPYNQGVVLSRNGVEASGSPWWVDSLDVRDGETYEIAFVADDPGIWMDHCHNLEHAAEGLVAHLMYEGVSTSYVVEGEAGNSPE
jgi:FtsP/CotA-like multicopper oxidase with cupredoxin domain